MINREWAVEEEGLFFLKKIKELLYEWPKKYNTDSNIQYDYYSFDSLNVIEANMFSLWKKNKIKYTVTSFSSAVRYKPTVKYNKVYAYIDLSEIDEAIKILDLKKVDSGGNVVIIVPYDNSILLNCKKCNDAFIVFPV